MPESPFTFNELVAAQAAGDLAALISNGRSVLSIDLGNHPRSGFDLLIEATRTVVT